MLPRALQAVESLNKFILVASAGSVRVRPKEALLLPRIVARTPPRAALLRLLVHATTLGPTRQAGLAMLEQGSSAQLLLAMSCSFCYLVLQINTAPLRKWEANRLTQVANIQVGRRYRVCTVTPLWVSCLHAKHLFSMLSLTACCQHRSSFRCWGPWP